MSLFKRSPSIGDGVGRVDRAHKVHRLYRLEGCRASRV